MSARVVSIREFAPRPGQYSLLVSELPGRGVQTLGVLLLDADNDELHIRLRRDWDALASQEDAEVLSALEDDLAMQSREQGGPRGARPAGRLGLGRHPRHRPRSCHGPQF